MTIDRKKPRNQSYVKVLLDGALPAYIRDISPQGFRVYSPVPLPYKEGSVLICKVIPSNQDEKPFDISGEIRWNRQKDDGEDLLGFQITSFAAPNGKDLYAELNKRFSGQ